MRKLIILLLVLSFCSGCGSYEASVTLSDTTQSPMTENTAGTASIAETQCNYPSTEATSPEIPFSSQRDRFCLENSVNYLDYWVFTPENMQINMPLIVFLHGLNEVGHVEILENYGVIQCARDIYGDRFPFIVLNPCSHLYSWTYGDNPDILIALIDSIADTYSVDRSKIVITGHSLGSIGTWYMTSRYGDYFSAAVPVSCGSDDELDYTNLIKVPIKAFAGDSEEQERLYANGMNRIVRKIQDAGGKAEMTVLTGRDHDAMVTEAYTAELFDWMLSQ